MANNSAPARDAAVARINGFRFLANGWDGYRGVAANPHVANVASIMASEPPSVSPMAGGGIQLEWHVRGYDIEIAIYEDGTVEPACWAPWKPRHVTAEESALLHQALMDSATIIHKGRLADGNGK